MWIESCSCSCGRYEIEMLWERVFENLGIVFLDFFLFLLLRKFWGRVYFIYLLEKWKVGGLWLFWYVFVEEWMDNVIYIWVFYDFGKSEVIFEC